MVSTSVTPGDLVVFTYSDSELGELSTRSVLVAEFKVTQAGNTLLVGLDEDRNEIRSFRLDRVSGRIRKVK
jgi:predicted DNA-binding transcriptional regulator YafY